MTIEAMKAKIAALTDEQIQEGVRLLAGAPTEKKDERMVRAYLIAEWEQRHGGEAADRLMDEIGL